MSRPARIRALLRRLDDVAYDQLAAEAARLAEENDQLRDRLYWAEQDAEGWRDDALRLIEQTGAQPGITVSGALVAVPLESHA